MLSRLDDTPIKKVPHREDFDALLERLGKRSANSIRKYLDKVIDDMPPDAKTGLRTFNSTYLGSALTPWPEPLSRLYDEACEFLGEGARDDDIEDRAALWFGLFVWERVMERDEHWRLYDPNLGFSDPNREPIGKTYFEQDG